ncbi:hypothetical protein [Dyadobacter psychrotolerans]|uniref:YfhO family protein n=1 Tax=Dyadobacter psychrotolerans TaxID=2541721 RepID=A0A4V2Z458_9BACT|nr:hypothetical protein [Dyadobacter psychrotolerans]TDE15348.1 hypothetical protein E0F88_12595 [Dyadobacter psychrotolerans]
MNQRYLNSPLWIVLFLVPMASFGIYIFSLAVNVPYNDDSTLISTLNDFNNPDAGFIKTILEQQNDHRVVFSRLATILIYLFHGTMNFRTMIILGYFNLILLGYAFYLIFKSENKQLVYFTPVCVLLFSPIVQATHLWSITAFEYTLAITFSLYCLYFLQPSKRKYWLFSIPFAMAATLSNLDGLCVIAVALVWLTIQNRRKDSLIFTIFSLLYLYLFFLDFHFSTSAPTPSFPAIIAIIFKGFIAFTGSIVKVISDSHAYSLSLITGGFFIVLFLIFTIRKSFSTSRYKGMLLPLNLTDISFLELMACALMVAVGRAAYAAESMVAIRFQVYAVSILILFYFVVISNVSGRRLKSYTFGTFLLGSIVLNLLSYVKYHDSIIHHNNELKADAYNFNTHALFVHQFTGSYNPDLKFYRHYRFPVFFQDEEVGNWVTQLRDQRHLPNITFTNKDASGLPEHQEVFYPVYNLDIANLPKTVPDKNVFLALFRNGSNEHPFLHALRPNTKGWLNNVSGKRNASPSFSVTLMEKIPVGSYDVAVCWIDNGVPGSLLIGRNLILSKKAVKNDPLLLNK